MKQCLFLLIRDGVGRWVQRRLHRESTSQMDLERINTDGLEKGMAFIPCNEWPRAQRGSEQEGAVKVHISSTEPWIRISVFGDESDSLKRQAGKKKKKKPFVLYSVGSGFHHFEAEEWQSQLCVYEVVFWASVKGWLRKRILEAGRRVTQIQSQ